LLLWLALAQIAGILLADQGWLSRDAAFSLGAGCLALGAGARRSTARAIGALGVACAAGGFALADRLDAAERARPPAPLEAALEGRVRSVRRLAGGFTLELDRVARADAGPRLPSSIRLGGPPTPPGVPSIERALPGEQLRLRASLRAPSEFANPGARGRVRELARAGIGATARLLHPALHVRVPEREGLRPLAALDAARATLDARLAAAGPGAGLLRALALGERSGLGAASQDAFTRLGLAHLLSVSGLHLALVAGLVFALAQALLARSSWLAARRDSRASALALAVLGAVLYALLSGWEVPVRRSLLLVLALALASLRSRRGGAIEPLAAASLVILAVEPQALFGASFQLSFAASAALAFAPRAAPPASERASARAAHALREALSSSATALAATAPIAALALGNVAPIGLLANLAAIPWTGVVLLPASLLAVAIAALPEGLRAAWALAGLERIAAGSLAAVEAAAAWLPTLAARAAPASGWLFAASLLALAAICVRGLLPRIALCLAANALLAGAPAAGLPAPLPRLVALDVGQGDALLVQGRRGALLVDAGAATPMGVDLGSRVVLPALAALGVERLDLLVVTHADLDHRGGAASVLAGIEVGALWLPHGARSDPDFAALLALAAARGVAVREQGAHGEPLRAGELQVEPLWPPKHAGAGSRNDRSLAVRVTVGARRVLLPGDLEASAEAELVASGVDLRADVLALAHHGSRTSSSAALLAAVAPQLALVSAPCHGRFGMPHPEVRSRARAAGAPVWWTGRDGALVVGLGAQLHVWGWAAATGAGPRCRRARRGHGARGRWLRACGGGMLRACPRSIGARRSCCSAARPGASRCPAARPRATCCRST
jgi:competence protein ComEC